MTDDRGQAGAGCFKRGCLGCGAAAAVLVAVAFVLVLIAIAAARREAEPEVRTLAHELPPLPPAAEAPAVLEAPPPREAPPAGEPPPAEGLEQARELGGALAVVPEPVRLRLDLSKGSFVVEPGAAGEPIRVEADYDRARFTLEERWDPEARTYTLRFDARGGFLTLLGRHRTHNEVRLVIPRGYPLAVEGDIGMGESRLDLGGLWLTSVDLEVGMGSHRIEFSEPLPAPLELVDLNGSMGELIVDSLGNASPRQVEVDHSMGALEVDLRGAWRTDAEIDVECGFGECRVRAPGEEVEFVLEHGSMTFGERNARALARRPPAPAGAPTVRLTAQGTAGELRID